MIAYIVGGVAPPRTRTFTDYKDARDAILAIEGAGVAHRCISVLTRLPRDTEVLEHETGVSEDLEDAANRSRFSKIVDWLGRVGSVAVPGLGPVLGTGDLAQDVTLAQDGRRGSITGALVGVGVPVDDAERLEESVFAGQTLVVVHGNYDPTKLDGVF
jgi:hypothetical protein